MLLLSPMKSFTKDNNELDTKLHYDSWHGFKKDFSIVDSGRLQIFIVIVILSYDSTMNELF